MAPKRNIPVGQPIPVVHNHYYTDQVTVTHRHHYGDRTVVGATTRGGDGGGGDGATPDLRGGGYRGGGGPAAGPGPPQPVVTVLTPFQLSILGRSSTGKGSPPEPTGDAASAAKRRKGPTVRD